MDAESGTSAGNHCGSAGKGLLAMKLRRVAAGKKNGMRTPVRLPSDPSLAGGKRAGQVSARKLGARLWELENLQIPLLRHRHELSESLDLPDFSSPSSSVRPQTSISSRSHSADSSAQNINLIRRNAGDHQPKFPASYSSSIEAVTPSFSFDLKRVLKDSEYGHKTSTAVEILNRVRSLEEQYASSMSLIKALKVDFTHGLSCVQEVMKLQRACHHEMLNLRMKIVEDGLIRINEEDVINAAVQSINEELKNERKLRMRSENFHHMVSKELSELKSENSKVMKDLDGQAKGRNLLEEICDEFAIGVRAYEQELRNLKHHLCREIAYSLDPSMLQISESWLEKRLQMRIAEEQQDLGEKNKIMERLNGEIMSFLQSRRSRKSANLNAYHQENEGAILCRRSVESLRLNENGRAHQDASVDDSLSGDFNSIDLKPRQCLEETPISQKPLESRMPSLQGPEKVSNGSFPLSYDQEQADKIYNEPIRMQSFVANGLDVNEGKQIRTPRISSSVSRQNQGKCHKKYNDGDQISDYISKWLSIDDAGTSGSKKVNASDSQQEMCHYFPSNGHFALLGCHLASDKIKSQPNRQQSCQLLLHENSLKAKLLEARLEGKNARWNAKFRK